MNAKTEMTFTDADLRAWIARACRFDKDGAGCDDIEEDRYSLHDEGRNDDGSGESYAERNA